MKGGYLLKAKVERTVMAVAKVQAGMSKDTTQVGAVLIKRTGQIIMSGYNGPPAGLIDSDDKFVRPDKYKYAAHAEENLITQAARFGIATDGCIVVCTHAPCPACMRKMIAAGIVGCIYGDGRYGGLDEGRPFVEVMVRESGFKLYPYNPGD